jgi:hypothetical protein
MDGLNLTGFDAAQETMLRSALAALMREGYDVTCFVELVWVRELPSCYRAMTLAEGAALGPNAFTSQAMLNHVLEEECRHHDQKARGAADEFSRETAGRLEEEVDDSRKFPAPNR